MTKNRRVSLYIYSKVDGGWKYRPAPERPKNLPEGSSYVIMWYEGEDGRAVVGRGTDSRCVDAFCHPQTNAIASAEIEDFTWHCLRHTLASQLVMKGVDIRTVQELMGHKTIQMTVRYAHLAPQHKLAAVERLCEPVEAEPNQDAAPEAPTDTRTSASASESVLDQSAEVPLVIAAQTFTSELGL